jgi:hypothetical protein
MHGRDEPGEVHPDGGGGGGGEPETVTATTLLSPLEADDAPHGFAARTSKRIVAPSSPACALIVSVVPAVVAAPDHPSPPEVDRETT